MTHFSLKHVSCIYRERRSALRKLRLSLGVKTEWESFSWLKLLDCVFDPLTQGDVRKVKHCSQEPTGIKWFNLTSWRSTPACLYEIRTIFSYFQIYKWPFETLPQELSILNSYLMVYNLFCQRSLHICNTSQCRRKLSQVGHVLDRSVEWGWTFAETDPIVTHKPRDVTDTKTYDQILKQHSCSSRQGIKTITILSPNI